MKTVYRCLLLLGLLWNTAVSAQTVQLTVMTSYPDAVVSRFEEAFEASNPDIRLQILWRMPPDALPYLLQTKPSGVDVYWTPSARNFLALKGAGLLAPIGIDLEGLPARMGTAQLSDPDGLYLATETAGYGLFVAPARLAELGVAVPTRWEALTDPRLQGQVALPVPAGVGYAHMLVDQLLQAQGWDAGWNLWREIAANSQLINSRGNFVTEEVASGRSAIGLTMDFFAASALARGGQGQFVYPQQTAFNPAQVAILADTTQRAAAERFVSFLLSAQGQTLLFDPALRKLPVRPAVYAQAPAGVVNPFELQRALDYDPARGLTRRALNQLLFDAAITHPHTALVEDWRLLRALGEARNPAEQALLAQAREQLQALPLAEPAADSTLAQACELYLQDPAQGASCAEALAQWEQFFADRYAAAGELLRQVQAGRS